MERTYVEDIPVHAQDGVAPAWVAEDTIVAEVHAPDSTALTIVSQQPQRSVLAALAHAGAVAWRQPAVRAAVRTGATAVALSVALRMAGRLVMSRSARQLAAQAALPGLAELLEPGDQRVARRGRGEVTETFIYIRRVTRR